MSSLRYGSQQLLRRFGGAPEIVQALLKGTIPREARRFVGEAIGSDPESVRSCTVSVDPESLATILDLCDFVIQEQEQGRLTPPFHSRRSGIFAECSWACNPDCLSIRARNLKRALQNGNTNGT